MINIFVGRKTTSAKRKRLGVFLTSFTELTIVQYRWQKSSEGFQCEQLDFLSDYQIHASHSLCFLLLSTDSAWSRECEEIQHESLIN